MSGADTRRLCEWKRPRALRVGGKRGVITTRTFCKITAVYRGRRPDEMGVIPITRELGESRRKKSWGGQSREDKNRIPKAEKSQENRSGF